MGKTSAALAALHDDRIERRFGENRRFIRCDEFLPTRNHFLRRLSKVIGAGIENPENLASIRQSLSSKEILVILDNAESILDPQGPNAREIFADVDELTRFRNICLFITSRISTIPPDCETLEIPILSLEAARDTFHRIYKHGERSNSIDEVLKQLDFHPLSITLLATVSQHNKWSTNRLTVEWSRQRTAVLDPKHSRSLGATIELSLASPTFQELGPDAREFLEVVAFFPQGINEENVHWQFPTIPDAPKILDEFCVLSLTYRNDGFMMMLAPLRDHLRPKDPGSSSLLSTTKEHYFTRLSGGVFPGQPGFEEARWISSEDVNVEHLLSVFTTADGSSKSVWDACARFLAQLRWHKPRLVTLGSKIEALPNDHPSKALCLSEFARLFLSVGNPQECRKLLNRALKLWREQGNDFQAAQTLSDLTLTIHATGPYEEGIQQAKEASQVFERLGYPEQQAECLLKLAWLLLYDEQVDAAEDAVFHAIDLLPEKGPHFWVQESHRSLGIIHQLKGEMEKAVYHLEITWGIASSLNHAGFLILVHSDLANLFAQQGRFSDAQTHVEHARSFAVSNAYLLARASLLQAQLWYRQDMFGEAKSEALVALDVLEKLGSTNDAEFTRRFLQQIDARWPGQPGHPRQSDDDGEFFVAILLGVD